MSDLDERGQLACRAVAATSWGPLGGWPGGGLGLCPGLVFKTMFLRGRFCPYRPLKREAPCHPREAEVPCHPAGEERFRSNGRPAVTDRGDLTTAVLARRASPLSVSPDAVSVPQDGSNELESPRPLFMLLAGYFGPVTRCTWRFGNNQKVPGCVRTRHMSAPSGPYGKYMLIISVYVLPIYFS